MVNIPDIAKQLATVLGTASVLGYITGYLAMRARAFALGSDPVFALVDAAYVFAGFRFLFVTLLLLLAAMPVVFLLRWGLRSAKTLWSPPQQIVDWVGVGLLTVAVLWIIVQSLAATGVLLIPPENYSGWDKAVLGLAPARRLGLSVLTLTLFCATLLWLHDRWGATLEPLDWLLGLLLAALAFLLPIQHGAFFADRNVRLLDGVPSAAAALVPPVAVVDGTPDSAILLGRDATGARLLTTVQREALNGVGVRRIMPLAEFNAALLPGPAVALMAATQAEDPMTDGRTTDSGQGANTASRGWLERLLAQLQLTLEKISSLGDSGIEAGQLWVVELRDHGSTGTPRRLGAADDLAWPVAGRQRIFAIQGQRAVEMTTGEPQPLGPAGIHWHKLVGVVPDGTLLGITVDAEGAPRLATLLPDGTLKSQPADTRDQVLLATLLQESRSYTGGRTLQVDRPVSGQGFDVFLTVAGETHNVSECRGDACGQPSLSADGKRVVFIREPRH